MSPSHYCPPEPVSFTLLPPRTCQMSPLLPPGPDTFTLCPPDLHLHTTAPRTCQLHTTAPQGPAPHLCPQTCHLTLLPPPGPVTFTQYPPLPDLSTFTPPQPVPGPLFTSTTSHAFHRRTWHFMPPRTCTTHLTTTAPQRPVTVHTTVHPRTPNYLSSLDFPHTLTLISGPPGPVPFTLLPSRTVPYTLTALRTCPVTLNWPPEPSLHILPPEPFTCTHYCPPEDSSPSHYCPPRPVPSTQLLPPTSCHRTCHLQLTAPRACPPPHYGPQDMAPFPLTGTPRACLLHTCLPGPSLHTTCTRQDYYATTPALPASHHYLPPQTCHLLLTTEHPRAFSAHLDRPVTSTTAPQSLSPSHLYLACPAEPVHLYPPHPHSTLLPQGPVTSPTGYFLQTCHLHTTAPPPMRDLPSHYCPPGPVTFTQLRPKVVFPSPQF
ncbi:hypothetical protein GDO81_020481 [Engystomops pustulosus]|uniref:Uncharacterized protein n=1 Tax=Engystomops pustulosus TaxID=76066 RepID=A0AAV6ZBL0_ENGPU|nr:hypothetical protein GDO81_020481 [Engystomops pustulosus]